MSGLISSVVYIVTSLVSSVLHLVLALLLLLLLQGCRSYEIVQSNVFSDENGFVVTVGYGRSDTPHVNTFTAPTNGQQLEFRSKLAVEVRMPDGDSFVAWQCMNFERTGTMYKSDDGAWMFQANGFTCRIFARTAEGPYNEVYRGILCETPKTTYEPDKRWRKLRKDGKGKWR